MFHPNVSIVDRNVARRRWLTDSGLPQPLVAATGAQPWVNPRVFLMRVHVGRGPTMDAGAGAGRGM
jgi:hypothetical protein